MIADDLIKLLEKRYNPPEFAFLTQVRNQTGFRNASDGIRTADALALSLFPSRGLHLYGFEIKVSRSDFLSEIKNPHKADAIARYCGFWWIVAPKEIVKLEELPQPWGWLAPEGDRLVIQKTAEFLKPEEITTAILCGIMRKASETMTPNSLLNEKIKEKSESLLRSDEWKAKYRVKECEETEERIKKFEELSGLEINKWDLENVADAVRIIREAKSENYIYNLRRIKELAKEVIENIEKAETGEDKK